MYLQHNMNVKHITSPEVEVSLWICFWASLCNKVSQTVGSRTARRIAEF
jgi:hypothetical protein